MYRVENKHKRENIDKIESGRQIVYPDSGKVREGKEKMFSQLGNKEKGKNSNKKRGNVSLNETVHSAIVTNMKSTRRKLFP